MKFINRFLITLLIMPVTAIYAADSTNLTRSAGKLVEDNSTVLTEKLVDSPVLASDKSKPRTPEAQMIPVSTQSFRSANHGSLIEFNIFDTWVELTGDIDSDGYYHHIKTTFDVDVNTPLETVYAKLYLSHEGGPWRQYAETNIFEINYDSISDTYEVVSELIEGYPPGYYDVLIEIHSLYHDGIVASRIITQDVDGYLLTIEDLQNDQYYYEDEKYYSDPDAYQETTYIHTGSFSWVGLIMLAILLIIKFRYFTKNQ